jgi:hypothetical protein
MGVAMGVETDNETNKALSRRPLVPLRLVH